MRNSAAPPRADSARPAQAELVQGDSIVARITGFCEWLLRRAVVWGGLAALAFHVVVVQNLARDGAAYQWFAGDGAVLKGLIVLIFFTGAAALAIKTLGLLVELGALERSSLAPLTGEDAARHVDQQLTELDQLPRSLRNGAFERRLRAAFFDGKHVGSSEALASRLAQIADADRYAIPSRYSGVRAIILGIPSVGFVGALSASAAALASIGASEEHAVSAAVGSGQLALNVVALSMATMIALVFGKLAVENLERRLLAAVDEAAFSRLHRFCRPTIAGADPHAAGVVQLCEKVLETVHTAVAQHDAALTKAIGAATRRWEEAASTAAALLHRTVGEALTAGLKEHAAALNAGVAKHAEDLHGVLVRHAEILSENIDQHTGALADALEHHTAVITQTETNLAEENRRCLGELEGAFGEAVLVASQRHEDLIKQSEELLREMQTALLEAAGTSVAQQEQLIRQGDVLLKVVEATGHVRKLEEALNGNLASLAASHHFGETCVGLSAALQLLSANLGRPLILRDDTCLDDDEPASRAA
jgi:hypothetical protein